LDDVSNARYGFLLGDRVEHVSGLVGRVEDFVESGVVVAWSDGTRSVVAPTDLKLSRTDPEDELAARRVPESTEDVNAEQWCTPFGSPKRWP
jgi:hypothetical protein